MDRARNLKLGNERSSRINYILLRGRVKNRWFNNSWYWKMGIRRPVLVGLWGYRELKKGFLEILLKIVSSTLF